MIQLNSRMLDLWSLLKDYIPAIIGGERGRERGGKKRRWKGNPYSYKNVSWKIILKFSINRQVTSEHECSRTSEERMQADEAEPQWLLCWGPVCHKSRFPTLLFVPQSHGCPKHLSPCTPCIGLRLFPIWDEQSPRSHHEISPQEITDAHNREEKHGVFLIYASLPY